MNSTPTLENKFILMKFSELTTTICQVKNDLNEPDELKTQQNKSALFLLGMLFSFRALRFITKHFDPHEGAGMINDFTLNLLFIILCRRKRWIFVTLISILSFLIPLANTYGSIGFIFNNVEILVSFAISTLIFTQSYLISTVVFCFQLFIVNYINKQTMLDAIERLPSEELLKVFLNISNLFSPAIFLTFVYYNYTLNSTLEQTISANKSANQALQQMKNFLQSFSHEIRNPMNSLQGSLNLLIEEKISPAARELVNTAKTCSELTLQMINNILDAGKADLGNLEVNPTPNNLYEATYKLWIIASELLKTKKLNCQLKIHKSIPSYLMVDSFRFSQIMMNLLSNALKFTETGSISVTIDWKENLEKVTPECFGPTPYDQETEGIFAKEQVMYNKEEYNLLNLSKRKFSKSDIPHQRNFDCRGILRVTVSDTGIGMSPEGLKKLFKKFSQVSNDPFHRQLGTGLGLFITKEIIEKMDGEIKAYSLAGHGSTFIVCIPSFYLTVCKDHPLSVQISQKAKDQNALQLTMLLSIQLS